MAPKATTRRILKPWIAVKGSVDVHGRQNPVRVVLHDTESHDAAGITDISGIFNFWKSQGLGYGAHFIVDKDGNVGQGARCRDETWHVGNYNNGSIGIEQVGFASYTELIWKRDRLKQLIKVARLLAWLSVTFDIPLVHSIERGVCTHADVGRAGIDPSGHTDPGAGYPLTLVLWLANRYVKRGGWSPEQPV